MGRFLTNPYKARSFQTLRPVKPHLRAKPNRKPDTVLNISTSVSFAFKLAGGGGDRKISGQKKQTREI